MTVTTVNQRDIQSQLTGIVTIRKQLSVTGMTASTQASIPHGLPSGRVPFVVIPVENASGGPTYVSAAADGTNVYLTPGSNTSVLITLEG